MSTPNAVVHISD